MLSRRVRCLMTPINEDATSHVFVMKSMEGYPMLFTGSKILILAKVIAGSISQNTYNYIAVARFNRKYLKISNFEAKNLSPPTFFEIKT